MRPALRDARRQEDRLTVPLDAAEAVADGDHHPVRPDDRVAVADARRLPGREDLLAGEPLARLAIEKDELPTPAGTGGPAEVEERVKGGRRDSALLHAG